MRKVPIIVGLGLLLIGCATDKTLTATGGSKSDGTVDMSYEFGPFEVPKIDFISAQAAAKQRCAVWGYTDAQAFGGEKRQCQFRDGNGICDRWFVTVTYQCTGAPKT